MIALLHLLLLVSSVASVNISLTSGELCEGAIATWTCVISNSYDGITLAWRNNGETAYPLNTLAPIGPDSPFNATLTTISSDIIASIATARLTNITNGSLLECSDNQFMSPSVNVTLILKDPEAANLSSPVFYGDGIRVSWSGATCSSSLRLSVYLSTYEVDVINVTGTTFDFIPVTSGKYRQAKLIMGNFAVLLVFIVVPSICSSSCSVEIAEPNAQVCLGIAATFTCTVNGTTLGWRYAGVGRLYLTSDGTTNLVSLGSTSPFSTRVTDVSGGIITSIATTSNLTRDADGMTLECSDGSFTSSNTQIASVTLPLQESSEPSSVNVSFTSVGASITWTRATCVPFYRVYIDDTFVNDTAETSFSYNPSLPGIYSFRINSINYFGDDVGSMRSLPLPWLVPTTRIHISINDSGIIVSFEDNDIGQPPVTDCNIILNGVSTACQLSETNIFPIRDGVDYTYNVTLRNDVGLLYDAGKLQDLIVPTTALISVIKTMPAETIIETVASGYSVIGDPAIFSISFIVLGVLIILSICWIILRICWKRQCCCPRIWRSSFWLIFFCYDFCNYDPEEKESTIGRVKNPNVGGEKGNEFLVF